MKVGLARRAAIGVGRVLGFVLPSQQSSWADAMVSEIAQVNDDGEALKFALGCLWAATLQAGTHRSPRAKDRSKTDLHSAGDTKAMGHVERGAPDPRVVGVFCAVAAVALGLVYLIAAGAPWVFVVINGTALVLGLIAFAAIRPHSADLTRSGGWIALALGGLLLATALFGSAADGAARWVRFGSLSVQVSLVALPCMVLLFARERSRTGMAALVLAATALALQPDRAMAAVLAASLAAVAVLRFDLRVGIALASSLGAVAVTLLRPDTLPAVPFVDRVFYTAFEVHVLVGAVVAAGSLLIVVPAIVGLATRRSEAEVHAAFGLAWLGIAAAAALGNYPTPLVGYGGSAVLGYLLSLAFLPGSTIVRKGEQPAPLQQEEPPRPANDAPNFGTGIKAAPVPIREISALRFPN